jgi:hypothetical protein
MTSKEILGGQGVRRATDLRGDELNVSDCGGMVWRRLNRLTPLVIHEIHEHESAPKQVDSGPRKEDRPVFVACLAGT